MEKSVSRSFFFFNDTATTEIYTLSLHDALPIYRLGHPGPRPGDRDRAGPPGLLGPALAQLPRALSRYRSPALPGPEDRKSTRLNSSHANISYAVFCFEKKKDPLKATHSMTVVSY